jgi:hypothetical protein
LLGCYQSIPVVIDINVNMFPVLILADDWDTDRGFVDCFYFTCYCYWVTAFSFFLLVGPVSYKWKWGKKKFVIYFLKSNSIPTFTVHLIFMIFFENYWSNEKNKKYRCILMLRLDKNMYQIIIIWRIFYRGVNGSGRVRFRSLLFFCPYLIIFR